MAFKILVLLKGGSYNRYEYKETSPMYLELEKGKMIL
jgi:hypothetical protein